jgi:hypothetical protein
VYPAALPVSNLSASAVEAREFDAQPEQTWNEKMGSRFSLAAHHDSRCRVHFGNR